MKKCLFTTLCLILPLVAAAGDKGYRVLYDDGSLPDLKAGTGLRMYFEVNQLRLVKDKGYSITIPASAITEVTYMGDADRRLGVAVADSPFTVGLGAAAIRSKSKKHIVRVTWANGDEKGGLALQCDENDYRALLAALEDITGLKAISVGVLPAKN